MPRTAETLASRYAEAVVNILADYFSDLDTDSRLRRIVVNATAAQASKPDHRFELIVTYTRDWRLHSADFDEDEWRVRLGGHKDPWTNTDKRFLDAVNRQLRAIQLEA